MSDKGGNVLDVTYCCDDGYAPYVGVSMLSCIESNMGDFDEMTFHIIEENISQKNKEKLSEIVNSYGNCKIKFYPFKCNINIPKSHYPPIGYATLFLADLLDIDKVLYVDGDTLIFNSFKKLFSMDLGDNYAAGVLDISPPIIKKHLNFLDNEKYYNAGVLFFDLEKIRKDNIQIKFYKEAEKPQKWHDQDIINLILKNRILKLPIKYNFFGHFFELDYDDVIKIVSTDDTFYSAEEVEESKKEIICTHFLNLFSDVPWKDESNPMYQKFDENVQKTPFEKEEIYKKSSYPHWKKTVHKILKKTPPIFYRHFASSYLKKLYK